VDFFVTFLREKFSVTVVTDLEPSTKLNRGFYTFVNPAFDHNAYFQHLESTVVPKSVRNADLPAIVRSRRTFSDVWNCRRKNLFLENHICRNWKYYTVFVEKCLPKHVFC